jgi:hypothetical protein
MDTQEHSRGYREPMAVVLKDESRVLGMVIVKVSLRTDYQAMRTRLIFVVPHLSGIEHGLRSSVLSHSRQRE